MPVQTAAAEPAAGQRPVAADGSPESAVRPGVEHPAAMRSGRPVPAAVRQEVFRAEHQGQRPAGCLPVPRAVQQVDWWLRAAVPAACQGALPAVRPEAPHLDDRRRAEPLRLAAWHATAGPLLAELRSAQAAYGLEAPQQAEAAGPDAQAL